MPASASPFLGFGNQGRAQSLNLNDSGIDVVVGLRAGSPSEARRKRRAGGRRPSGRGRSADVVMLLAPDEVLGGIYQEIEPQFARRRRTRLQPWPRIHFGLIKPRADLDVFLVAPKGPGTALRSLYAEGKGMVALWAVHQDATGKARGIALAYGRAIGCGRAGLMPQASVRNARRTCSTKAPLSGARSRTSWSRDSIFSSRPGSRPKSPIWSASAN